MKNIDTALILISITIHTIIILARIDYRTRNKRKKPKEKSIALSVDTRVTE